MNIMRKLKSIILYCLLLVQRKSFCLKKQRHYVFKLKTNIYSIFTSTKETYYTINNNKFKFPYIFITCSNAYILDA